MSRNYNHNDNNNIRIAILENTNLAIKESLQRLEDGNKDLSIRIDKINSRIDSLAKDTQANLIQIIRDTNSRFWTTFLWNLATYASLVGLLAKVLHWI